MSSVLDWPTLNETQPLEQKVHCEYIPFPCGLKFVPSGDGEMALWLRALVALKEVLKFNSQQPSVVGFDAF